MARLVHLVIPLLVTFAACTKTNPRYCDGHPGVDSCPPDAAGTGPACSAKADCKTAELPVCDTAKDGGQCVACTATDHGVCGGTTPRCESDSCVACVDDGDCPDSVCLLNGACADPATVVHAVATGGSSTSGCGQPAPAGAGACTLDQALMDARGKPQTIIKLDDAAVYAPAGTIFVVEPNADVILDLRVGATLTRRSTSDGAVITVNGGGKLTLLDGTISGGRTNPTTLNFGDGVTCNTGGTLAIHGTHITVNDASAVSATACKVTITRAQIDKNNPGTPLTPAIRISGGTLTMTRSTVQGNRGGGLDIKDNATFTVLGNAFSNNGIATSNVGGIVISTTVSGNRLEFNSIAENTVQDGLPAGVGCVAGIGFIAANNIIWNNNSTLTTNTSIQVSGTCKHRYSDIGPTSLPSALDAGNNKNTNPMFMNAMSDLHLTSASPTGDLAADPAADISGVASLDLDGDRRTAPATMGADQPRAK